VLDEMGLLRNDEALQRLLGHYAEVGAAQPEAWQDRVMQLDGMDSQGLTRLHGLLIAFGWVDQNTGQTPVIKSGVVACCYRATRDGLRALKQARGPRAIDETDPTHTETAGAAVQPKRKRAKEDKPETPVSAMSPSVPVPAEAVV
jgi:hypothetical protein